MTHPGGSYIDDDGVLSHADGCAGQSGPCDCETRAERSGESVGKLRIVPMMRDEANEYVARHHRHSKVVIGYRFALGASVGDQLVGVAIVGRPVARGLQDGWTCEVLRLCTTGTRNACSFLYGACWRAARALGYTRLVTYTLASEGGSSLRAAGLTVVGEVKGRHWTTPSRPRDPSDPQERLRWELNVA